MTARAASSITILTLAISAAVSFAAQNQTAVATSKTAAESAWKAPRTPDGHPDLQGVWDFRTLTPLERPSNLSAKEQLTDQEAAELEERAAANRVDRAPRPGDPGTYNQFWFDFGTKVV